MPSPIAVTRSYLKRLRGKVRQGLWILRLFACIALTTSLLAMFVFKSGNWHDFCLGLTVGILLSSVLQSFAISSIELKQNEQRSDVDNLSIVR